MPREESYFKQLPTRSDRIANRIVLHRGRVIEFSVQYETLFRGDSSYTAICRIDNCDEGPHRHLFHAVEQDNVRVAFPCNNLNEGLTEAQKYLTVNDSSLRYNYLTQRRRRRL